MIKSILVVDDNEGDQMIAERVLKKWGYTDTVFRASDGQEALEFLISPPSDPVKEKFPPPLILLDIDMPGMDGFGFLKKFSALLTQDRFQGHPVSVVMYTSSENQSDKDRSLQYDCVKDYIIKPLSRENLAVVLEKLNFSGAHL